MLFIFGNLLAGSVSRFLSYAMFLKTAQSPSVGTCSNIIIFFPNLYEVEVFIVKTVFP